MLSVDGWSCCNIVTLQRCTFDSLLRCNVAELNSPPAVGSPHGQFASSFRTLRAPFDLRRHYGTILTSEHCFVNAMNVSTIWKRQIFEISVNVFEYDHDHVILSSVPIK